MSGWGGPESIIESISKKEDIMRISSEDRKAVAAFLDWNESKDDVRGVTKEQFEKAIANIRRQPETSKENALILQTYAVLFLGVKSWDIGGIDGVFWPKTMAIFRKCQADGIWGKSINVKQNDLKNIDWSKITSKDNNSSVSATTTPAPETPAPETPAPETPAPENQANNKENMTQARDGFIQSLKDIKVGEKWIPSFLAENIKPDAIRIVETGTSWVYEVVLPKGNEQVKIEWTVFINKDWRLVDKWWEMSRDTTLNLTLPKEVAALYIPLIWESAWITEFTKNGKLNEIQAKELIWLIKSVGLNWWPNTLVLSQKDNEISLRRV